MVSAILSVILLTLAYLCGSINSAIIVCKIFDLPDPRAEGSKNPGATNVLRLGGKKSALMVLIGDMLKGLLPVLLAKLLNASPFILGCCCLAAVLGHMYPLFFQFKGGKGVATALGSLLGLNFIAGVCVIAIWLLVANFFRYSSLASMIALLLAPFFAVSFVHSANLLPPLLFMAVMILYKHRHNVTRLIDKTEPKIKLRRHQLDDITNDLISDHNRIPTEPPPPPGSSDKLVGKPKKPSKPKKSTKDNKKS